MKKESKLTDLLALMVLLVFALCILMVLLTGTRVYQRLLDNSELSFTGRTGVHYVSTRVRQAQSVSLTDFEGCSALDIPEVIDGEHYHTLVYWYEGYIRELYCEEGAALLPEDGEKVLASEPLSFSAEGSLVTAQIGADRVFLHLPLCEEAGL